jgi:hypothetical protein
MPFRSVVVAVIACCSAAALPDTAAADTRVTGDATAGSYVRYDGATDAATLGCSTGRRTQNEPSVAVDPRAPSIIVAGSNDYCAEIANGAGNNWAGYYRSTDGGRTWTDSLVPGYPVDESAAGAESPAHGECGAAGDPTQAFDGEGRLFYGFICFNRVKPTNGSIYLATYDQDGARYVRTRLIERGTPSVGGLFQDKINITADQSTGGPTSGNVYVAWARFSGSSVNDVVYVSRSTDHGLTFSKPRRLSAPAPGSTFADLAVGPDGTVYLTYRSFSQHQSTEDAIWVHRSTDGGVTWSEARRVAGINRFDSDQYSGSGASDCGDGPFLCPTGLTFARFASMSAIAADDDGVHVVFNGRDGDGQSKVFVASSPDGLTWDDPAQPLDDVAAGHQFFPDIAAGGGDLHVVFQDSRADPAYSPALPPGNTASGVNSGDVVDAFLATSSDGGQTWTETQLSGHASNPNWEVRGQLRDPFFGDYNYVSAAGGAVYAAWTDTRDLVAGSDPRGTAKPGGADTFDGFQTCAWTPNDIGAAAFSSPSFDDACLSQGGLDQNIYGGG